MGGPTGPAKKNQVLRPFPVLTPQSYVPGSANAAGGAYPRVQPGTGSPPSPGMPPNLYPQPPPNSFQVPPQYPNMGPGFPPRPSRDPMSRPGDPYRPRFASQPRVCHRHGSRRCRPVIHIIESDSCTSLSTCSSDSSCSPCYRRSHSCPRRRDGCPPQQQPVIFLPVHCQPQSSSIVGLNQPGAQSFVAPMQQPPLALTFGSSMQPSLSMPQIVATGRPQQFQAGPIQYVQSAPYSSSSQLRSIPAQSRSSTAQQSVLVESTKKQRPGIIKPIPRAQSVHHLPQGDLKLKRYGSTRRILANRNSIRNELQRETSIS